MIATPGLQVSQKRRRPASGICSRPRTITTGPVGLSKGLGRVPRPNSCTELYVSAFGANRTSDHEASRPHNSINESSSKSSATGLPIMTPSGVWPEGGISRG